MPNLTPSCQECQKPRTSDHGHRHRAVHRPGRVDGRARRMGRGRQGRRSAHPHDPPPDRHRGHARHHNRRNTMSTPATTNDLLDDVAAQVGAYLTHYIDGATTVEVTPNMVEGVRVLRDLTELRETFGRSAEWVASLMRKAAAHYVA